MPNPLGLNAGRPEKYKPAMNKTAKLMAECGWTDKKIAEGLQIHIDTLIQWRSKYPKFSEAIHTGRYNTPASVVKSLGLRARGIRFAETTEVWAEETTRYAMVPDPEKPGELKEVKVIVPRQIIETKVVKKFIPPDVTAIKYVLNNRDPEHWKDASHIDHTTGGRNLANDGMDLSKLTDEEVAILAALELKAKGGEQ